MRGMNAAMSTLEIHQIPTRVDNYVYLVRESSTGEAAVVDPSDAAPVFEALDELGWNLTHVLATHHHNDHIGGVPEIKERTGCTVVGPRADRDRIPGIDIEVGDGDTYMLYEAEARVFDVPGHTRGHIAYWFPESEGPVLRRHAVRARLRARLRRARTNRCGTRSPSSSRCPTRPWSIAHTNTPSRTRASR